MLVAAPVDDLHGGRADRSGDLRVQDCERGVDGRRGCLDLGERGDVGPGDPLARHGEVLDRTLRLRPPPGCGRHPHLAH